MLQDLISVIIPIYGVEKYLDECISSVCNQTYRNLEIILVDDGSRDRCPQLCDAWSMRDDRIRVIHKKNGGLHSARQAGISTARGKYVGYVDGDDYIEPDMYEKMISLAQIYGADVVETGVINTWEKYERMATPLLPEGMYRGEEFTLRAAPFLLYSGKFYNHGIFGYMWNKLFLREKLMIYQMMPDYSNNLSDDVMCSYPCIAESRSLYISHQCLYHYRVRGDSLKRAGRRDVYEKIRACYDDWISRFKNCPASDGWNNQIQAFVLYLLLSKAVYVFDEGEKDSYLKPFGGVRSGSSIALYGAGMVGRNIYDYVSRKSDINVVCWVDKNYESLRDPCVVAPEILRDMQYEYVIICVLMEEIVEEIKSDLSKMNIPESKVRWINNQYVSNPQEILKRIHII